DPSSTAMTARVLTRGDARFSLGGSLLRLQEATLRPGKRILLLTEEAGGSHLLARRQVANAFKPTSMPAWCPVLGNGAGSAPAHEKVIDHVPVLLRWRGWRSWAGLRVAGASSPAPAQPAPAQPAPAQPAPTKPT